MRFIALITVLLFSLSSVAAVNVKEGDIVPEAGVFLTVEESAKILAESRVEKKRCEEKASVRIKLEKIEDQLLIDNLKSDLKAETERNKAISLIREREISRLYEQVKENNGEYNEYFLIGGISAGVLVSALISTAIFFAAVQITKTEAIVQ